jgi:hypothetical protein
VKKGKEGRKGRREEMRERNVDALYISLNFTVRIQSPVGLNPLQKITLKMSSRSKRSQLPDCCLYICHLQLHYIHFESRSHSSLQTCKLQAGPGM